MVFWEYVPPGCLNDYGIRVLGPLLEYKDSGFRRVTTTIFFAGKNVKQSKLQHLPSPYLAQHPGHDNEDCHSFTNRTCRIGTSIEELNNALNRDWTDLVYQMTGAEYFRNRVYE